MQKMCIDRNHANGIMFIRTSVAKKQQNKADANKEWTRKNLPQTCVI